MTNIELEGLDLTAYIEVLKNKLEVYMIPLKTKKNYYIGYTTRFGSEITTFKDEQTHKEIKVPDGIAHFLEHKMFEQEDGIDPFTYFSNSGTDSNAFTTFDNTQYLCEGTKNFEDNLRYLIKFVNAPYYTDENVEKEKGIISEELKMYEDMPDYKIETRLRENIYVKHPRRIDIGGTIEEITKITKEDLYKCYSGFYSPNNMFLIIAGNFDKDKAIEIIHEELDNVENRPTPEIINIIEPEKVNKKEDTIYSNVKVPKIGLGLKVPTKKLANYDDLTIDLYLEMFTTICFGSSSEFRERVRQKKILENIYTEWESINDYKVFLTIAATTDPDELIKEIKKELITVTIDEDTLTRMKKVWIANEVRMADYLDSVVRNNYDDLIRYKKLIPDKIKQIRNMNLKDMNNIIKGIDFNNIAVVKLLEDKKNIRNN